MSPFGRAVLATAVFGVCHSALASRQAKEMAAGIVGQRARDGGYRFFYVGQSVLASALLLGYLARLPATTIYHVRGPGAMLLHAGQAASLLQLLAAARAAGVARLAGLANLRAWMSGASIPPGPAAQGPETGPEGRLAVDGPFRWSRHPLNLCAVPLFWLTPRMTSRRLAFNLAGTAYFVLGSMHEAMRLRRAYGRQYAEYEQSGVPFFWPRMLHLRSKGRVPDAAGG